MLIEINHLSSAHLFSRLVCVHTISVIISLVCCFMFKPRKRYVALASLQAVEQQSHQSTSKRRFQRPQRAQIPVRYTFYLFLLSLIYKTFLIIIIFVCASVKQVPLQESNQGYRQAYVSRFAKARTAVSFLISHWVFRLPRLYAHRVESVSVLKEAWTSGNVPVTLLHSPQEGQWRWASS